MKFIRNSTLLLITLIFNSWNLFSADIIEILPLTKNIIMLHLKDGYAIYHKAGEARSNEKVVVELLNATEAARLVNYTISSTNDANYTTPKNPLAIGRKTKGAEFTWMCQNWDNTKGCVNNDPDHVKEHWIYLTLPTPMEKGKTYIIQTGALATNGSSWTIKFNENQLRSEAVHVNQIGYSTNAPKKFGYVYHWMGDKGSLDLSLFNNAAFNIIDLTSGLSAFSGNLKFRKGKTNAETGQISDTPGANFLAADVYECDFSSFNTPGEYILVVDGIGSSFPFKIEADIYRMPYYTAIRGLYHNRSGIELKQPYTAFTRPAPHNPAITPGFSGKLKYTTSRFVDWKNEDNDMADKPTIEAGDKGVINTWGWYQDAGDWDSYYSHFAIPTLLMFTWETAPFNFRDNELNIPESGNGIPDILDEASWLLRFGYRTRHEIIKKGFGTGGLGMRVFGDLWGKDEAPNGTGRGSWEDNTRTWYVSGEDPYSTFKYAALSAQMAFCLKTGGFTDTIDWKKEAIEAYTWAKNNTRAGDETKHSLKEIRAYASASLYRLTGETAYQQQLISDATGISTSTFLQEEARWAPYIYTAMPDSIPVNTTLYNSLKGAVLYTADNLVNTAESRACRFGGNYSMPMLVGQATTPWVFEVIMGYRLTKVSNPSRANQYLACVYTSADYFLGCNPLNTTWITGLGIRQPQRVFHMDSWYSGKDEMSPGITPYGPWRVESYSNGQGPWDLKWPHKALYPADINVWPGHERWFGNYTCPLNAEFTIHQNTIYNAAVFGFLCSTASQEFTPNRRPHVELTSPLSGSAARQHDSLSLAVNVSDPDGDTDIYKVEYYNKWHKIGESTRAPYSLKWKINESGTLKLSAKIIDKSGLVGKTDTIVISSAPNSIRTKQSGNFKLSTYPNPSNSLMTFEYSLETDSDLLVEIYDVAGRKLETLANLHQKAGKYQLNWFPGSINACSESSSVLFCRYKVDSKYESYNNYIKLVFLK